jgi:hypothetical protein
MPATSVTTTTTMTTATDGDADADDLASRFVLTRCGRTTHQ